MDVKNGTDAPIDVHHIIMMFWDLLRHGRRSKNVHFPTNQLLAAKLDFAISSSRVVQ